MMMNKILVIHGPNLNLLGERETGIYGKMNLEELNEKIRGAAPGKNISLAFFQSNHEGKIIDFIHENRKSADAILINPGALTHYSYALRDAISSVNLPTVEVHLSDIQQRESFRKKSVIKDVCIAQISGLGADSYLKGLELLVQKVNEFLKT